MPFLRQALGQAARGTSTLLRQATASRRPLPNFLIIGAQKAGTTSLHEYLCEHPMISPSTTKEVHYFDLAYHRGPAWYRAHFHAIKRAGEVTGESSPYYLYHPLVPARVAEDLPESKLIVIFRNPIDRTHSHYNHEYALGHETLQFEDAIEREAERLDGEEERIAVDPDYRSFPHQHHSYIARSLYADQLERWFSCFDRDRFLILSAEDLFERPRELVAASQQFLGLEPVSLRDATARNARLYTSSVADDARHRLREKFEPHNQRLYELVDRDFGWD
jgi:sulfotransferase family protein